MTKATMLKKLLAICLALMFILSMPGVSTIVEAAGSSKPAKGEWKITKGGTYTINDTYKGYIVINASQSVTLNGSGTIDASKWNTSAITIEKGDVTMENVTVTGGTGTDIVSGGLETRGDGKTRVGGGVFVNGGTFNLKSGTITGNTAERGGGIFVNKGAIFNMTGGKIDNNSTKSDVTVTGPTTNYAGEGGGIFVWGIARISGGEITNNHCNSEVDLGGGGLYVNNGGTAVLINAVITNNTANGFGGGVAGCCHAQARTILT